MAARNEDDQIRAYVERLAAFESDGDAPLDAAALREIATQVGVSDAAIERADASALLLRAEGAQALRRGDLSTAVATLQSAIELAPADHVAMSLLGDALRQRWHQAPTQQAETEREAARRVLRRAQALHWTPENDAALADLERPRRPVLPSTSLATPATAAGQGARGPAAAAPAISRRGRKSGVFLTAIAIAVVIAALAFIVVLIRDQGASTGADAPDGRSPAGAPRFPLGSTQPKADKTKADPASTEVTLALPWTLDAPGLDGLRVDGGGVIKRSYRYVPASFRLDVWLRWSGDDALTGLSVSFELLDSSGDVVRATNAHVIQAFHPAARPGDVLPVHVQPMVVNDEELIASARLRVVAAQHAPLETLATAADVPISWVVRTPEGVKLRATVRADTRSAFGSSAQRMRSQQVDVELHNEGSVAIAELQTAQRYRNAAGDVVYQGDNDSAVPSYLPPLRPGDIRLVRAYESSLPEWSTWELVVQAIQVAPAP